MGVPMMTEDFQPDFELLEAALTDSTAAVIVNSPNNPTGTVLTEESMQKLEGSLRLHRIALEQRFSLYPMSRTGSWYTTELIRHSL